MKFTDYILFVVILMFIWSCDSALDVDTPRVKYSKSVPHVIPRVSEFSFEENGVSKSLSLSGMYIEIDTNRQTPLIWLYMAIDSKPYTTSNAERICLGKLEFKLDSLPLNGAPIRLNSLLDPRTWAKFSIFRGLNIRSDTSFYTGPDRNIFEISFNYDRQKSEIWSVFYSRVYDYKVWMEKYDTTLVDTVSVCYYDTIKVNEKIEIHERWERELKEVKLTLEKEMRSKDSLFLNGKFLLKF